MATPAGNVSWFPPARGITGLIIGLGLLLLAAGSSGAADVTLTPFGQSPDAMMVKVVLKKNGVTARLEKMLTAGDLKNEDVLVVVVGGSSKGMGAAGINKEDEIKRARELIAEARNRGIKVLVMHVGGNGRRGKLSDQFISEAVPMADRVIVVESGDQDGLISGLAKDNNIPMDTAPNVRQCDEPLRKVFDDWQIK